MHIFFLHQDFPPEQMQKTQALGKYNPFAH